MNKYLLNAKMKSKAVAYLCWFLFGCQYAYLGQWGKQILYWVTLGGLGVWAIIDLFRIGSKVSNYNLKIALQIAEIEKNEALANNNRV